MSKLITEAWAFVVPEAKPGESYKAGDKQVLADSTFRDADHAWEIGLGWPSREEIEEAKKRGCRVVRVRIEEIE